MKTQKHSHSLLWLLSLLIGLFLATCNLAPAVTEDAIPTESESLPTRPLATATLPLQPTPPPEATLLPIEPPVPPTPQPTEVP